MGLPSTWTELLDRLARVLADDPETGRVDAEEWLREAIENRWGAGTRELERVARQIAFQKASGVLLALEEEGRPDELVDPDGNLPRLLCYRDGSLEPANGYPGRRGTIAGAVSRYFDGVAVEGPPWKIDATETDRPTRDEYARSATFA